MDYSILAKKEIDKKNIDLAIVYYKIDLDCNINCDKFLVYNNISILYFNLNNFDLSLKYIINSIKLNPNWYKSWMKLGYILEELNKNEESLKAFVRAKDLSSDTYSVIHKIESIKRKIVSLQDTDSESSEENTSLLKEEKIEVNNSNINMNTFSKVFNSSNIKEKLKDPKIINKILDNKNNPFVIFKDKDIYNLMQDMYKEYKKD